VRHSRTFHGLDALRAVAAISLILFHASSGIGEWLAPSGYLAVDVFFVMSGFVIAHSYEERIRQFGVRRFMTIRVIRFLPFFYLGGVLGIVMLALLRQSSILGAATYFLFLPAPPRPEFALSLSPINGPGWSLLFEIYVNLAYAALLPRLSTRVILLVTTSTGAALAAASMAHIWIAGGSNWPTFWVGVLRVTFSFSTGVALFRFRDRLTFDTKQIWPVLIIFFAATFVPASSIWNGIVILFVSPALVVSALRAGQENWMARYGATSSYGIYVIHAPLLSIADEASRSLSLSSTVTQMLILAVILLAVPLLDRWFDRPLRRLLTKWWL